MRLKCAAVHCPESRSRGRKVVVLAVAADPDDAEARLDFGNVLAQLGRQDEATRHWQEGARLAQAAGRTNLARECQRRLRQEHGEGAPR